MTELVPDCVGTVCVATDQTAYFILIAVVAIAFGFIRFLYMPAINLTSGEAGTVYNLTAEHRTSLEREWHAFNVVGCALLALLAALFAPLVRDFFFP